MILQIYAASSSSSSSREIVPSQLLAYYFSRSANKYLIVFNLKEKNTSRRICMAIASHLEVYDFFRIYFLPPNKHNIVFGQALYFCLFEHYLSLSDMIYNRCWGYEHMNIL